VSGVPLLVEGAALPVLIVGGGAVAVRKANTLAASGARVRVVASLASQEMRALADAGRVALDERPYDSEDVADAVLVIAATNDRTTNAAVAEDARRRHRLVNVADAPETGTFANMATHRAGHLVVGVSAGGVPGAAARIRDAIAARFDSRYGAALELLGALRRSHLARGDGGSWRALSSTAVDERFCDSVEQGTLDDRVATWR
jgi:precorrin-2 dehydrogenase / sirohydrochlorin ferrochelatase